MPSGRFQARRTVRDAARVLYDRVRSARPSVRHFGLNCSFRVDASSGAFAVLVAEKAWMRAADSAQPCV